MSSLALVEELERRDRAAAAALAGVEAVQAETEHARAHAEELLAFLAALPGERERLATAIAGAEGALAEAVAARARAEEELQAAKERRGEQERALLARRLDEARASERTAADELERLRTAAERLEQDAARADADAQELDVRARDVAQRLAKLPRLSRDATLPPHGGLAGVADWGARVRAALLLLHAQLVTERDAIVREANELGSALLGEPLGAASVARVRERVAHAQSQ